MSRFVSLAALLLLVLSASLLLRAQPTPALNDPFGDPAAAETPPSQPAEKPQAAADPFARPLLQPIPPQAGADDPFAAPAPAPAVPAFPNPPAVIPMRWHADFIANSLLVNTYNKAYYLTVAPWQGLIKFADESLGKEVLAKMTPAERMAYHLGRPATIDNSSEAATLPELLADLSERLQVNVELDTESLEQAAFDQATPFHFKMTHPANLGAALHRMLQSESLDYLRLQDTLLITTRHHFEEKLFVKTYSLDREMFRPKTVAKYKVEYFAQAGLGGSLGAGGAGGFDPNYISRGNTGDNDPLADIIQLIEPASWKGNGGGGELHLDLKRSLLVVSQRQDVHDEIEVLLADLRKLARSNQQAIQANAQLERRVVFRLKLPEKVAGPPVPCGNGLGGGEIIPLEPAFSMKEVADLIKQQIEPHTWKDEKHTITILGECLIINQSEAVQTKIYQFLLQLGITREQFDENNRPFYGFS